jgi:diguanylate cyclase (GGDEF)-like protein
MMDKIENSGLSATELKAIAVVAMLCDHIAWAYLDNLSLMAQFLHVIGRLTIPIMCFCVAEGFKHTHNLKRYILRMAFFAVLSAWPFYYFFGNMYGYRQNIIFDLLMGLLLLTALEHTYQHKAVKVLFVTLIVASAMVFGGWAILPALFILIFHYKKDFKSQAIWVVGLTILVEILVQLYIIVDQKCGLPFAHWVWYEKLYLLAFMLPVPFLKLYNGKRGCTSNFKYFFYLFYPIHMLVLGILQRSNGTIFDFYLYIHVGTIFLISAMCALELQLKPSKAQIANILFLLSTILYMVGYYFERTTNLLPAMCMAIKIEYFGWFGFMLSYLWFVREFCRARIPKIVFVFQGLITFIGLYAVFTIEDNHWFYETMETWCRDGHTFFTMTPGFMFYIIYGYFVLVFLAAVFICSKRIHHSVGTEKKRYTYILVGTICPWVANILKLLGFSEGYDILTLGVLFTMVFFSVALIKYGYYNSIQLAGENAIAHGNEGIIVTDASYRIVYYNDRIKEIFSDIQNIHYLNENRIFKKVINGVIKKYSDNGRTYELRQESLMENGYIQGYMYRAIDMTEHYASLERIKLLSETDPLTGLRNRSYFVRRLGQFLQNNADGALLMMDIDNFKEVNDCHGHDIGDRVLVAFGKALQQIAIEGKVVCRLGGDEFCAFLPEYTAPEDLKTLAVEINDVFRKILYQDELPNDPTISIGIRILNGSERSFQLIYKEADEALYKAKNRGKNQCSICYPHP